MANEFALYCIENEVYVKFKETQDRDPLENPKRIM